MLCIRIIQKTLEHSRYPSGEGRQVGERDRGRGLDESRRKERNNFKKAIGAWRRVRIIEMKNIFDHYFSPGYNSTKFKR